MATLRALHVQKQVALRKPQDEKKAPPAEAYDAGAMQGVRSEPKRSTFALSFGPRPL